MIIKNAKCKIKNAKGLWLAVFFIFQFSFFIAPLAQAEAALNNPEEPLATEKLQGAEELLNIAGPSAGFPESQTNPEIVVGKIVQGGLAVVGVVFGLLVIYGGYLWMIARGNEEMAKKARGILEMAVIGFIIIMGAYALTSFVVDRLVEAGL